nr:MAG TPA: hypothetical protein [Caudoviricetes sp.]
MSITDFPDKKMKHGGMKKATLIMGYQGSQRTILHE